jgi:leucyl aminopeptidase
VKHALNFDVRVLSPKEMKVCSPRTVELVLRPHQTLRDFKTVKSMISKADTRWSPQLLRQLEEKMADLWVSAKDRKLKPDPIVGSQKQSAYKIGTSELFQSVTVHFDAGGRSMWSLLAGDLDIFETQTALRRLILPLLEENQTSDLRIDLREFVPDYQRAILEACGSLLVLWEYRKPVYGKRALAEKPRKAKRVVEICTHIHADETQGLLERGLILGSANNLVRGLSELPSNVLNPESYRRKIQERARAQKYQFEFYDTARLKRLKAGAILSVLAGDPFDRGGIAHATWKSKRKPVGTICLVGKGLCFDTGGHNLKTGPSMFSMHRDMTGSAVVLALFETIKDLDMPLEVHAFLALAENMISPLAYRPNDIVTAMNGTSIEVVDTDAEGRMVLADTLALASEKNPHLILDFATLTGAAMRAIGTTRSAVFSNQPSMLPMAMECGEASGERVWGFPLGEEYNESLKSQYADVIQCAKGPSPDHILAATFLARFIGEKSTWVHCDLSCEENRGGLGLVGTDVTGFGVRWGLHLVERFFMKNT